MKDPVEVRPPGGNSFLVVLWEEASTNQSVFSPLDDLPLDSRHSSEVRPKAPYMSYSKESVRRWCNSRRELVDCLGHGIVEVAQPPPVQHPVEGGADVSAGQPKFDIIGPIYHLLLGAFQNAVDQRKTRRLTLIIARITPVE